MVQVPVAWPAGEGPRWPLFRMLRETTVVLVLLTLGYYLLPLRVDGRPVTVARFVAALVAFSVLAVVFRWQVRHSRTVLGSDLYRIMWLLSALYLLVLGFALGYAVLAANAPDQFIGVTDRTAALYLAMTVVSTVGFGDVHPSGHGGQIMTIGQMVFDVAYLGTAVRMLVTPVRPTGTDAPDPPRE